MFLPHPLSIVGSLCDREVACSASDHQGLNFESCVGRQCYLTHLTIIRRFFWPNLAWIYTKVAWSPIPFISFILKPKFRHGLQINAWRMLLNSFSKSSTVGLATILRFCETHTQGVYIPLGTRRCCDVASTLLTLI